MKKTLIALAALAVVSAASAQSSVTLYGVVDMSVSGLKDQVTNTAGKTNDFTKNGIVSNALSTSRLGFKGTEDLGGGLKANFVYEFAISPDEKAFVGDTRVGTVGVSGDFGSVAIGRQYTPYHGVQGAMDLYGNINAPGYVVALHNRVRASNAVTYATPNISGFTGAVQVAAGDNAVAAGTQTTGNSYGLSAVYAAGPLVAGFAYDSVTKPASTGVITYAGITGNPASAPLFGDATSKEVNTWAVGASYDFAVVKAALAYSSLTDVAQVGNDTTSKGYNLSVSAPFGATTLLGNFGRANVQSLGFADSSITGYQFGANYALSKRTTAYALMGSDELTTSGVADAVKRSQTSVGIRHTF